MNIIKQAWGAMRQQPVLSAISVTGTALAIFLIMVVVMLNQVPVAPFAPESHRNRFLHARYGSISYDHDNYYGSNGPYSRRSIEALFKGVEGAEAVTAYGCNVMSGNVNVKGNPPVKVDFLGTDADFWQVFDFTFVEGKPYDEASFESGLAQLVLTESVAREVFGSTDVVGREIQFNYAPYTVVGVVEDVSTLASSSYSQVWIPYTSENSFSDTWNSGLMGSLSATILVKDGVALEDVREQCLRKLESYNKELEPTQWSFVSRNRPYDQEAHSIAFSANNEPDVAGTRRRNLVVYLILLIVPAVNLSSMTESRLRQRVSEIGVRRAFGSTRIDIVRQILLENMSVTLIAGMLGLLLSVVFAYLADSMLFAQPFSPTFSQPKADVSMLLQWSTFLWALLFCFILNLLSTGIPAWRASYTSVVNAISGRQH
ncbi:MAG: ABC transporter permease [Muribaculum sp.]|nr:ABC transporter permease [Muribaculum sp.]